ncbi:phospholipase D family protein [Burkholderia multivorans]|uniref:phospholipase D family protein n=1 Tax=Burkholderia multivorans TaxID=87883 RepID=UPI002ED0CAE0
MPRLEVLSPLDQPLGKRRLLEDLKTHLSDKTLDEFGFVVAFAKVGPFLRLQEHLGAWHKQGKRSVGLFGIDHQGTSVQALQFALVNLQKSYYVQYAGHSFHPKLYWFKGDSKAVVIVGSNNMTVGGTELNFEAAIELTFKLPDEADEFNKIYSTFASLLPDQCVAARELTAEALEQLESGGFLLDETKKANWSASNKRKVAHAPGGNFKLPVKPASTLPYKTVFGKPAKKSELAKKSESLKVQAEAVDLTKPMVPVGGLVMQIKPHHNGEIFLSKTAAEQNPAFFGMPFTGQTMPKKGENDGYPQRTPDPVCNVAVFGKQNKVIFALEKYALNTVFYTKKSEIRVTASPLVPHVPEYSVLIMTPSGASDVDYDMQIFTPDSPDYQTWVDVCDQQMPGGGKVPRKFGWF